MGDAMTIRRLIIDSGDRSVGTSKESIGDSGCEALDDSPGPEVLALLVEGLRTELLGREIVASGVVGGLLVSYL